ncbi:ABC transporter substrate-binding protein [Actinomadura sp. NBRC 104425]|uniref:ABC transporter permease n=1 Tax=Actinomadura sp. NBRC 104425 TaxID=3032204 RepID=UPI0024A526D4|nr:ABC transporter permease [Actinomadura sp. NBRC 104425]GLZ14893.1 ABC transporter substrate-binding protein [Actinomadura sp. NBRC 104425]
MWRLILRNTLARRGRLALTMLSVVLGVTFATGSLVLTDTSRKLLDDQFRTATAGVDLTVRRTAAFDSAMGVEVERDPLPATATDRIRAVPGVAEARPMAGGQGLIIAGGKAAVPSGRSLLSSWAPEPFGAFTLRAGSAPDATDEVVIDAATAERYRIAIGDTVTVQAERSMDLRVVGLAGFGDEPGMPNATVALVALPTAQFLLDLGESVSQVAVVADDGVTDEQLRDRVAAALGAGHEVTTGRDLAAAGADAAKDQVAYLQVMLLALAAAALLVGAFLIANTFSIVVAQRVRELAVVRAVGATGRQILASVLGEALLVGVTASLAGIALGVALAGRLRDLAGAFGVVLSDGGMVVAPRTVLAALAVGVLVTVVSAVGPARRAARVAPVEAMRHSSSPAAGGRLRTAAGLIVTVPSGLAVVLVLTGRGSIAMLGAGASGAIVGLTLLGPVLAPRLARVIGRPLGAFGVPGRLARRSAARAPRRTAATVLSLALGLALIGFMTVVAASAKDSLRRSYTEVITADYVVESARGEMLGGLPPAVHHHLAELPEVAVASRLRYGHWKDGAATAALTAVDPVTLPRVTRLKLVSGSLDALNGGGIILTEKAARSHGLRVGDRITMTFPRTGVQHLPVVGLMRDRDAQALSTDYVISLDTFARHFAEDVDASVFLRLAGGVTEADARKALQTALAGFPTADLRDQAAAVEGRTKTLDQVLGLVTVLLMFTIAIALLGITNTLALSVLERTREIGLLRAVGMTRAQLRHMIRGEAVLIAALAVTLGLSLGIAFGAATVAVLAPGGGIPLVLPVGRLALVVAVATVAGLAAGLLPARRAARQDVLEAIAAP